jgi:hypothetical protein
MQSVSMRFPSKVDWWIPTCMVLASIGAPLGMTAFGKSQALRDGTTLVILAVTILPVLALLLWVMLSTAYVIDGDELVIRCGPTKSSISIASITRIRRSSSPASAPAASLRRLEVHYGRYNEVLISPRDRREFIRAIVERVPGVVLEDLDEYR